MENLDNNLFECDYLVLIRSKALWQIDMSTSKAEDRDVSERKLLVDDIERIRQVLHTGAAAKLSSDEEEEEESDEDGQEGCREDFIGLWIMPCFGVVNACLNFEAVPAFLYWHCAFHMFV